MVGGAPFTCSGLMYCAVPITVPGIVTPVEAPSSRPTPKSPTNARPRSSKRMFAGFRSRWMTPAGVCRVEPGGHAPQYVQGFTHG